MNCATRNMVEAGQAIRAFLGEWREGRITAFVKPKSEDVAKEIFFLSASHIFGFRHGVKILNRDGQKIGRTDSARFSHRLDLWRTNPAYNCLRNVCVGKIDLDVRVRNSSSDIPIAKVVSAADHLFAGAGEVWIKGEFFGVISRVKANPEVQFANGTSFRTSGFFVERMNRKLDMLAGSSGRPVFTESGALVGMIVASLGNELFCLDMAEVLQRLNCELIEYVEEGSVQRAFA